MQIASPLYIVQDHILNHLWIRYGDILLSVMFDGYKILSDGLSP